MVGQSKRWHAKFFGTRDQLIDFRESVEEAVMGMRVEVDKTHNAANGMRFLVVGIVRRDATTGVLETTKSLPDTAGLLFFVAFGFGIFVFVPLLPTPRVQTGELLDGGDDEPEMRGRLVDCFFDVDFLIAQLSLFRLIP